MPDLQILKDEIETGPFKDEFAVMGDDHEAVAAKLMEVPETADNSNRRMERKLVPAVEVSEAVVESEWNGLSSVQREFLQTLLVAGAVNVKGPNTRATLLGMFAAETSTGKNLAVLRWRPASIAEVKRLGTVRYWHVARARALGA